MGLLEETALAVRGVSRIKVDVEERVVRVTFDDTKTTAEAIRTNISDDTHISDETTFKFALQEVKPADR